MYLEKPGIKPPGREADHLPSIAKVNNGWSHTSTLVFGSMLCTGTTLPEKDEKTPPEVSVKVSNL